MAGHCHRTYLGDKERSPVLSSIRVALAYSSGYDRLAGRNPIKTDYYFFCSAMFRNKNLEIERFDTLSRIDISELEKNHDVVLLPHVDIAAVLSLAGIRKCNIPVVARSTDPHAVLARDMIGMADSLKIDWFFDYYAPASFYDYYPRRFKYGTVHIGLEPSLYEYDIPWNMKTPDKIALSGVLDKPDLAHKLYYRWYLRRPRELSSNFHYKLRTKCAKLPYVVHTRQIYPGQSTDRLNSVLSGFRAAIAAMTTAPTIKFKETPAAGCLTFMESTRRNHGVSHLGFEDGRNAILIDESNYRERFQEFLDSPDDPRWERIAREGRRHALENLSNDVGVEMLVSIMRKALGDEDA